MPTTVINIKTDPKIKKEAKKIASKLGLTLSGVINAQLREFIKTKSIFCSLNKEIPNAKLLSDLEQAKKDKENDDVYSFNNIDNAIKFLDK